MHQQDPVRARVVAVHRGAVLVRHEEGEWLAPVPGRVLAAGRAPVVGDLVVVGPGRVVEAVLPAFGEMVRGDEVIAANVSLAIAVTSLNQDLSVRRVERLAAMARGGGTDILVLLTKSDLVSDPAAVVAAFAERTGEAVLAVSAHSGAGLAELRARLAPGEVAALLGMSGVGKSTIVNALLGEDRQRTLTVRPGDDRGRHATTHRELFELPGGALLADMPGMRLASLGAGAAVADTFGDIAELAKQCRFADCRHTGEPGCAVAAAVAEGRLESDRVAQAEKLAREAELAGERAAGARGRARRNRRERRSQRTYREVQQAKRRRRE